jgi:Tol biopolymer transport system component
VYVRDTRLDVTARVSVCPRDAAPNGRSWHPAVSADGRHVAFVSDATNLVPGDRNRSSDVFLFDRSTGSTTLVSRGARGGTANGASALPAISADGTAIAFHSDASDLVCARQCPAVIEDINLLPDVFLFERTSGVVTRISGDRTGGWMAPSVAPALDARGRILTFTSRHPTGIGDDRNDFDLFVSVAAEGSAGIRRMLPSSPGFSAAGFAAIAGVGGRGSQSRPSTEPCRTRPC